MKALILVANDFEDLECFYPYYRLREEGFDVKIAAPTKDKVTGKHGYTLYPDLTIDEIIPSEYDILILPGGKAPERVRLKENALKTAKHFFEANKPVGAICHGIQTLISANLVKGKTATCWIGIRDDLIAAGAIYQDREVVIDGNLVTSRQPSDLPSFMKALLSLVKKEE
ncbi:MAG: type 1 glutamine amidotransferase domain-containing protein [Candidatus Odinarchaeia archaeon]